MSLPLTCLCGAVTLELSGEPRVHLYCHCRDCQAAHGAAYVPAILYRAANVQLASGTPKKWKLRTTPRWSCAECGVRLLSEGNPEVWGLTATLFPEGFFQPSLHINCASARLPVRDALPHYADLPEAFGGSGRLLAW
jgi:hypothetical protein